jgi:flavin reductase (DIM6/NTAB) family NADH-FMN oxidoreductase RutF
MNRRITGFHLDDEQHWVAELECGHGQHVRHDPPWQVRPWVLTPGSRQAHLGTMLDCRRCDEARAEDARLCGLCEEGAREVERSPQQRPAAPVDLFRCLTTGVYVIGEAQDTHRNAFTAAWLTQVSFDPLLIVLSVNPGHASYPVLHSTRAFTVNILPADRIDLAEHYGTVSGRSTDKLQSQQWRPAGNGCPILLDGLAVLTGTVIAEHPAGDHALVVGRVDGGELLRPGLEPLGYRATGNLDGSAALYPTSFT